MDTRTRAKPQPRPPYWKEQHTPKAEKRPKNKAARKPQPQAPLCFVLAAFWPYSPNKGAAIYLITTARRMVGAGRVFCPPRVQCSPPARKPETDAPPRVFVWPCFGRISKIQKFNILRRNKTTFAPVFGRFWRVFGRVLDVFGQRAKECSRAAETARRVCQLTNTKRPALFLLWRHTRRVFDMDETGAGLLCTFW